MKSVGLNGNSERLLDMSKVLTPKSNALQFARWAKAVAHAIKDEKQDEASAVFLADGSIQSETRK